MQEIFYKTFTKMCYLIDKKQHKKTKQRDYLSKVDRNDLDNSFRSSNNFNKQLLNYFLHLFLRDFYKYSRHNGLVVLFRYIKNRITLQFYLIFLLMFFYKILYILLFCDYIFFHFLDLHPSGFHLLHDSLILNVELMIYQFLDL